jgi:trk system potassium uptake protein TrkH
VRRVGFLLSSLLLGASGAMVVPLVVALGYGETGVAEAFTETIFIGIAVGAPGIFLLRADLGQLSRREGLAVVALGWALVCLLGSLPFAFTGVVSPVNAWFETVSGFTGTGASVIPDVESLPKGILFWRSFTHWLGGMGFVVLYIALFPLLGVGAMQLYRAEVPGLEVDRLRPRIRSTAQILWLIYLMLSAGLTLLLLLGGMDLFEAVCQMFAAIGTGGFSTRNSSIAAFDSAYIDWVMILFMWLAATNFSLHWAVVSGRPMRLLKNPEWRFFTSILAGFSLIVVLLVWTGTDASLGEAVRSGVFEVVSMGTTTGFATADYELWAPLAQYLIFLLLFMGGCAGSTAGAMKVIRVQLFSKQALRGMFLTVHPRAVAPPRLGEKPVTTDMMRSVFSFVSLYLTTWAVGTALMSLVGMDFVTATSSVATAMGGIGPGLGDVGPTETYVWVHPAGKAILTFCMLAGRLELFTVLLLFSPSYWRR